MSIHKSYAVFGLGRYGFSVAKQLVQSGADVLAVDCNQSIVNSAIGEIPICKCADVTDMDVLKQLGVAEIDVVIIALAKNLEASVMAVMLCKELKVGTVIVKCANEMHKKILEKVGADKVTLPEFESGVRLAKNLLSSGFIDAVELDSNVAIVEIDVRDEWANKSILELNLRKHYGINIVAIRSASGIQTTIDPNTVLEKDMKLVVISDTKKLKKIK